MTPAQTARLHMRRKLVGFSEALARHDELPAVMRNRTWHGQRAYYVREIARLELALTELQNADRGRLS